MVTHSSVIAIRRICITITTTRCNSNYVVEIYLQPTMLEYMQNNQQEYEYTQHGKSQHRKVLGGFLAAVRTPSTVIEQNVQRIYTIVNTWKYQYSCKINSWTIRTGYGGHTLPSAELVSPPLPPTPDATTITLWILEFTYNQQFRKRCKVCMEKVNIKK